MRALVLALVASLILGSPAAASGSGAQTPGEEFFTLNELRVPLADSDPIRVVMVKLLLVMETAELKAAMRSQQKAFEQTLVAALSQLPTEIAIKPAATNDVKKIVAQAIAKSGIQGVKDILLQKYVLW